MFKNATKVLQERIDFLEKRLSKYSTMEDSLERLKEKIAEKNAELHEVTLKKKAEDDQLKHMIKMKEEKIEVEKEKFQAKLAREKDQAVAKVKDEYRNKIEDNLNGQIKSTEKLMKDILDRLPNVTARLKGEL